ncbi:hypothetical protein B0H14DRAFT_2583456 [Mycena olivaceomarginata]|nr:hypothetical protein B0H14DRAFT_2583456 [Mycena olivaceomarginata]
MPGGDCGRSRHAGMSTTYGESGNHSIWTYELCGVPQWGAGMQAGCRRGDVGANKDAVTGTRAGDVCAGVNEPGKASTGSGALQMIAGTLWGAVGMSTQWQREQDASEGVLRRTWARYRGGGNRMSRTACEQGCMRQAERIQPREACADSGKGGGSMRMAQSGRSSEQDEKMAGGVKQGIGGGYSYIRQLEYNPGRTALWSTWYGRERMQGAGAAGDEEDDAKMEAVGGPVDAGQVTCMTAVIRTVLRLQQRPQDNGWMHFDGVQEPPKRLPDAPHDPGQNHITLAISKTQIEPAIVFEIDFLYKIQPKTRRFSQEVHCKTTVNHWKLIWLKPVEAIQMQRHPVESDGSVGIEHPLYSLSQKVKWPPLTQKSALKSMTKNVPTHSPLTNII